MTTARPSRRYLALLAGGPLLADLMLTLITFSMNLALVRQGLPPRLQSWVLTIFAIGYTLSASLTGRIISLRWAGTLLVVFNVLMAVTGSLGVLLQNYALLLAASGLVGVVSAVYFVAFQVKMGNVQPFPKLAWTVAFYNVSWGVGWSLGPLIRGLMEQHPERMVFVLWIPALIHLLLCYVGLWRNTKLPGLETASRAHDFASTPAQRLIGWMGILTGSVLLFGGVLTLWPQLGKLHGLSEWHVGLGVFVTGVQIPIGAMLFAALGRRIYRPYVLAALLVLGGVGYWLLPGCFASSQWAYPLALACLAACGLAISGGFFHSVLYSNADPVRPGKSVGINESLVGVGNILGPLIMGNLAWNNADNPLPYRVGFAITVVVALAALAIWARRREADIRY